jgi:hypothetical protein
LGAAGSQLWQELKELVKGLGDAGESDLEAIVPDHATDIDVEVLARALAQEATNDPQLRSRLKEWRERVQVQIDGDVSNTVTGEIHGKVIQARDIGSLRIE